MYIYKKVAYIEASYNTNGPFAVGMTLKGKNTTAKSTTATSVQYSVALICMPPYATLLPHSLLSYDF